jgi:peptidoglycan/LPS O-acetylase OafA/YrhL
VDDFGPALDELLFRLENDQSSKDVRLHKYDVSGLTDLRLADPPTGSTVAASRLEYIDGLRAFAALWVAIHHAAETSVPSAILETSVLGPVISSLFFGQFPVMIFLMLSGFCLYYPYVRKSAHPVFSGYAIFLRRRWTRIAPPFLWAGLICLPFVAFPALNVGMWADVSTLDPYVIASHLLLFHNLIPTHATKIDYPMWSIGLEWQLYLLFPLMVSAFRRAGAAVTIGTTLLIAVAIRATYRQLPLPLGAVLHDGPFSYLEIFAVGMAAAALAVHGRKLLPNWVLGFIVLVGLAIVRLGTGNGLVHDLATTAAFFAVLQLALDPEGFVARALNSPWLARIGVFSYSIYLVHAPLLHLSWFTLLRLGLGDDLNFVLLVVVCLPIIVVGSYYFHCVFERPFMRLPPKPVTVPVIGAQSLADMSARSVVSSNSKKNGSRPLSEA